MASPVPAELAPKGDTKRPCLQGGRTATIAKFLHKKRARSGLLQGIPPVGAGQVRKVDLAVGLHLVPARGNTDAIKASFRQLVPHGVAMNGLYPPTDPDTVARYAGWKGNQA